MMLPLSLVWAQVKVYANAILAVAFLAIVIGVGVWIRVLRSERDAARKQAATLQVTVDGYVGASKALQERLDAARNETDVAEVENHKLMAELAEKIPQDPSQATAWAIEASKKIAEEAKR